MLCSSVNAAEDQVRMITATGRAVISNTDALNESKNAALEDALYLAALSGGAKIDGFSSVQADTSLDDHFIVRPSSEILDYNIIDETHDDLHYQVTVQAAVGTVDRIGCQNRLVGNVTMFAPAYSLSRKVPGWLSTTPHLMAQELYNQMAAQPKLVLTNQASTKLDITKLLKDSRYDYSALTSSRPKVTDGDFAFTTEIELVGKNVKKDFNQQKFVDVKITTRTYAGSHFDSLGEISNSVQIKVADKTINQTLSTLLAPKRAAVRDALFQAVETHAENLTKVMLCQPLSGIMTERDGGLHVNFGARQGLSKNHLAIVSGKMTPWSILRVTEANDNSATLMPLNRRRNLSELNGEQVTFLEFN